MKKEKIFIIILLFLFCMGCAREIRDFKMTRSIFLKSSRDSKVYVDVRNTSQIPVQGFDIENRIKEILTGKGYSIVEKEKDAEIRFRVVVRYSGLAKDVNTGIGAGIGAGVGYLGGMAIGMGSSGGNYSGSAAAGGAAVGILAGLLAGYAAEEAEAKSTFVSVVDVLIEESDNPFPHTTSIVSVIRQYELKPQEANKEMADQVATQLGNIF